MNVSGRILIFTLEFDSPTGLVLRVEEAGRLQIGAKHRRGRIINTLVPPSPSSDFAQS